MKRHYSGTIACLILAAFLTGCALKPKMIVADYAPPKKLAVLPMSNQSNDLRGPEYIRKEFVRYLQKRGYIVSPLEETDVVLREKFGVTDGGQLNAVTPVQVSEALGVDAVVYGDLIDFKFVNVGVYQNKLVEANFKMVDRSGRPLWEDQRKATKKELNLSLRKAGKSLAKGVTEKAVGNILNIPLYEQVKIVVKQITSTVPKAR